MHGVIAGRQQYIDFQRLSYQKADGASDGIRTHDIQDHNLAL
jgi:hypothetical protein